MKEEAARDAWQRMRALTHRPETLEGLRDAFERMGLTPGIAKALMKLSATEPTPMRNLAATMRCDNSYVTAVVDALEERGIARREAHPTDRRIKVIVLTDEGVTLWAQVQELVGTPPSSFAALSKSETAQLRDLLEKLCPEEAVPAGAYR